MLKAVIGRDSGRALLHLNYAVSALALMAAAGLPLAAHADGIAPPAPPPTKVMDQNGVNLISGLPSLNPPSLSSAGIQNSLANIGVTYNSSVTDYHDSFTGYMTYYEIIVGEKRFNIGVDIFSGGCDASGCTYWDKDGNSYLFAGGPGSEGFAGISEKKSPLVQITKPDGEIIKISILTSSLTFTTSSGGTESPGGYIVHNVAIYYPKVVTSSSGWMMKYEYDTRSYTLSGSKTFYGYVPKKIYIINTSVDYCNAESATCTSSNTSLWPTWNITYPSTYSDASGAVIGYFTPERYALPSGRIQAYDFALETHRVTNAYVGGMTTAYAYSWTDGTVGTAPYIITATKPDQSTYSVRSEKANFQAIRGVGDYGNGYYNIEYFYLDQISSFTDGRNRITKYEYNNDNTAYRADNRSLKRIISPEATYSGSTLTGGYTEYGYDARRNITSVSVYPKGGGSPLVTRYEYEASCTADNYRICNKVKKITDTKNNVTDFVYYSAHGGLKSKTMPPDANNVRPEVRYTYSLLTPMVKDASNTPVASTPVYRLTQTSSCRVATSGNPASCVGTADEVVTSYAYNTNNLLKTSETTRAGDNSVSATTSYSYDLVGNVIAVDGPIPGNSDISYTTYDIRRRPVFEISPDPDGGGLQKRKIVKHNYNVDGVEYLTEVGTGNATDGSDFVPASFTRNTYDTTSGLLIKTEVGQP